MDETCRYPRAGQAGVPGVAREVELLLEDAVDQGVPLRRLGPSLVLGFARFMSRLPARARSMLEVSQVPLLYLLLGSGTGPLKMNREDAAYQGRPVTGQRCGNCSSAYKNLVTGDVVCSQVEGKVNENGWSRLWNMDRG